MGRERDAVMSVTAVAFALTILLLGDQDAGLHAVWKDGEIRQTYDSKTRVTDLFLAWLPSCAQANPTVTFHATFKGREPAAPPESIAVRADLGIRYSPNVVRTMTLSFTVDDGSVVDLSSRARPPMTPFEPGSAIENASAQLDLADFIHLLTASRVTLNVFGSSCKVSAFEMEALRRFAKIAIPR